MEYDNLVSKNQRPRSTFVGKNGSVQLVHEEEVAYCKKTTKKMPIINFDIHTNSF